MHWKIVLMLGPKLLNTLQSKMEKLLSLTKKTLNCHYNPCWRHRPIYFVSQCHSFLMTRQGKEPGHQQPCYWPNYNPRFNEVDRGVYWYHLVRLSVCGQNRVRSVSSTILIGFISYLHILSSNLRRCVACNARFKIKKIKILANFLNL